MKFPGGFRSPEHQGHTNARTGRPDSVNPYPHGCGDFYRYQDGANAFRRGDVINRRGDIVSPQQTPPKVRKSFGRDDGDLGHRSYPHLRVA